MKERNEKVVEIILRNICIISVIFGIVSNSTQTIFISFILYFVYKVIREILFYVRRMKKKETYKFADTLLLVHRVIFYMLLIFIFSINL